MAKTRRALQKSRGIKKGTRSKNRKMEAEQKLEEAKQRIEEYKSDPKIQIYKVMTGREAFDTAQSMIFPDNLQEGNTWANNWSDIEKDHALFAIYARKLRKNIRVHIELYVGTGEHASVLGEKLPLEKAMDVWSGKLI
jgi:hypothetical protein